MRIERCYRFGCQSLWVVVETGFKTKAALQEALDAWRVLLPASEFRGRL